MSNIEESLMGSCYSCGCNIPISEIICNNCLDDMEKESAYEDYLNNLSQDNQ